MNIYEKLDEGRALFHSNAIKGTGKNDFAGWSYIDLTDILPTIREIEHKLGYITLISFTADTATARVVDIADPTQYLEFTSPMSTASLKGCHEVQNLGAVQSYLRRYLYFIIYEVVEHDQLDKAVDTTESQNKATGDTITEKQLNFLMGYFNGDGKDKRAQAEGKYGPVDKWTKQQASTVIDYIQSWRNNRI